MIMDNGPVFAEDLSSTGANLPDAKIGYQSRKMFAINLLSSDVVGNNTGTYGFVVDESCLRLPSWPLGRMKEENGPLYLSSKGRV